MGGGELLRTSSDPLMTGRCKGFEIRDFRIFWGKKILASIDWVV